ncbi:hypothetical protein Hbal_2194 [Hirschia baltica ATCC 49814]|uniref:Uncharacterized protein n=1 Tax=Hirschia baltica (strain ATCC 49814 / DSM 5838 / IFAM 1418) TaxID=582402 RepID=C6XM42_HIRBI|nr:hypothetical protein Hbal_2194 [Hirschia baltica ATCC 49814]
MECPLSTLYSKIAWLRIASAVFSPSPLSVGAIRIQAQTAYKNTLIIPPRIARSVFPPTEWAIFVWEY